MKGSKSDVAETLDSSEELALDSQSVVVTRRKGVVTSPGARGERVGAAEHVVAKAIAGRKLWKCMSSVLIYHWFDL